MVIGIFTLMSFEYSEEVYYNKQDIGLGKALALKGNHVYVYNLVKNTKEIYFEDQISENLLFICRRIKKVGCFTFTDLKFLNREMNVLICFSDNQMLFPKVYSWCRKNSVLCIPYIGVVKSHNKNKYLRIIKDLISRKNLSIYRKLNNFVKTPDMREELKSLRIKNTELIPVGLDSTLLKSDSIVPSEKEHLKRNWGYQRNDKIILFVGRMVPEKRPVEMLELFSEIYQEKKEYRLIMIGSGALKQKVESKLYEMGLSRAVSMFEQIPYHKMWEIYCISDCMINLNRQEIYGMSILESMYYGVLVYAFEAPGPNFILKHLRSGILCRNKTDVLNYWSLEEETKNKIRKNARRVIETNFTWDIIADKVQDRIGKWLNE